MNIKALEAEATRLRNGVPCAADQHTHTQDWNHLLRNPKAIHFDITFEDGVIWVCQIPRRNATCPPAVLRDRIIKNEVANLKFLANTSVPSPRVFGHGLELEDNSFGASYILREKQPGHYVDWNSATEEQKLKVLDQCADIFIELSRHPFDSIGSLNEVDDTQIVGSLTLPFFSTFHGSEFKTIGPFASTESAFRAEIQAFLDEILWGIWDHGSTLNNVDAYLICLFFLELIPRVLPPDADDSKFYLKFCGNGCHMLVDDDYNLVGTLDWACMYICPLEDFYAPAIIQFGDWIASPDFAPGLSPEEAIFADRLRKKGRTDLVEVVQRGKDQMAFHESFAIDLADFREETLLAFHNLRKLFGVDADLEWNE